MSGILKQKSCIKILRDFDQHQTESVLNIACMPRRNRGGLLNSNVSRFLHILASLVLLGSICASCNKK